jgi:uncharacterized coiled-coil DUF342 family protein
MDRGCLTCSNKSACVVMDEETRQMVCQIQQMKEERDYIIAKVQMERAKLDAERNTKAF